MKKRVFKASEAAQGAAWIKQQQEKAERKGDLIKRLRDRSVMPGDMWDDMANEAERELNHG